MVPTLAQFVFPTLKYVALPGGDGSDDQQQHEQGHDAYPRLPPRRRHHPSRSPGHGCTPFLGLQIDRVIEEVAVAPHGDRYTSVSSLSADCQPFSVCFCAVIASVRDRMASLDEVGGLAGRAVRVVDEPQLPLAPLAAVTLNQVGAPQGEHRVVGEVARSEFAVTRRPGGIVGRGASASAWAVASAGRREVTSDGRRIRIRALPGFSVGLPIVAGTRVLVWMGLLVWLLAVVRHDGPGRGIRRSAHGLRGALTGRISSSSDPRLPDGEGGAVAQDATSTAGYLPTSARSGRSG